MKTTCALLAFLALTLSICGSGGSLDPAQPMRGLLSLLLALAALGLALAALTIPMRRTSAWDGSPEPSGTAGESRPTPSLSLEHFPVEQTLAVLTAVALLWMAFRPALGPYWPAGVFPWPVAAAAAAMGLVTAAWPRGRLPAVLLIYALLSAWLILAVAVELNVDMRVVQEFACRYLTQDVNPYSQTYPDPRDAANPIHFPYPPLNILMVLPGWWLGDTRWSLTATLLAAFWLLAAAGRRQGLPAGHPAELTLISLLANPWGVLVVMLGWTDPQLAFFAALAGWARAAGRHNLLLLALAGLISVKQYGILFLPAFWLYARLGWRDGLKIAALAAVPVLPFFLWGPQELLQGVVGMHLGRPFRPDSLSVLALVASTTGVQLPALIGFLAALAVIAFVAWKGVPTLADVGLANAGVLLAFILFNQDAHLNYLWLSLVFLAQGLIACQAPEPEVLSSG